MDMTVVGTSHARPYGRRLFLAFGWGSIAAVVVGLAFTPAFACAPLPLLSVEPRSSGAAGSTIGVDGLRFTVGPAEVRWNTVDGPLLATATGPDFHAELEIPRTAPGLYALLGLSRGADGSVGVVARTSFEVTDGSAAALSAAAPTVAPSRSQRGRSGVAVAALVGAGAVVGGSVGLLAGRRRHAAHREPTAQPAAVASPAP